MRNIRYAHLILLISTPAPVTMPLTTTFGAVLPVLILVTKIHATTFPIQQVSALRYHGRIIPAAAITDTSGTEKLVLVLVTRIHAATLKIQTASASHHLLTTIAAVAVKDTTGVTRIVKLFLKFSATSALI